MNTVIYNRFFEFNFVLFPVWIVFAYFSLGNLINNEELTFLIFLMLFGETHFASTFFFYFEEGNRSYIKSRIKILILIPVAIIGVYVLIGLVDFEAAVLLGAIASGIHVTRQSIGIQRLYSDERVLLYEYLTYISSGLFLLIGFSRFYLSDIFERLDIDSDPVFSDHISFVYLSIILVVVLSAVALSERINIRKKMVNLTGVLIYAPYLFVDHTYDAIIIGVGAHWCQYLAINYKVYFYDQKINSNKIALIAFVVVYAITMSVIGFKSPFDNTVNLLILIPLSGQAFHYYADAFIWRFSDPYIRNAIGKKLFA